MCLQHFTFHDGSSMMYYSCATVKQIYTLKVKGKVVPVL